MPRADSVNLKGEVLFKNNIVYIAEYEKYDSKVLFFKILK